MEHAVSLLDAAINVIFVATFLSFLFVVSKIGMQGNDFYRSGVAYYNTKVEKGDWANYEGKVVRGDTVAYVLDTFCKSNDSGDSINASVSTKQYVLAQETSGYRRLFFNGRDYSTVVTDAKYLDPNAVFTVSSVYEGENVSSSLMFVEVGVDAASVSSLEQKESVLKRLTKESEELSKIVEEYKTSIGNWSLKEVFTDEDVAYCSMQEEKLKAEAYSRVKTAVEQGGVEDE